MSADGEALVAARGAPVLRVLAPDGHRAGGGSVLRHRGLLRCARRHPGGRQGGDRQGLPAAGPPVPPGPVQGGRTRHGGGDPGFRPEEVPAHRDRVRDVKGRYKRLSKTEVFIKILIPGRVAPAGVTGVVTPPLSQKPDSTPPLCPEMVTD